MLMYIFGILLVIILLGLIGYLYERDAEAEDRRRFPPPGKLLDVDGERLHFHCLGEHQPGKPVVVLESGQGLWSLSWSPVIADVAQFTRVITYDRAGYGWSAPGKKSHTLHQVVSELHALLHKAGEEGPFVLVGHARGGLYIRQFYAQYAGDVVGMVLIDATPEKICEYVPGFPGLLRSSLRSLRLRAFFAHFGLVRLLAKRQIEKQARHVIPEQRALNAAQSVSISYLRALSREAAESKRLIGQKLVFPGLGERPLAVIKAFYPENPPQPKHSMAQYWKQHRESMETLEREYLHCSSCSRYFEAKSGNDMLIAEEPRLVVNAIEWVVDSTTKRVQVER